MSALSELAAEIVKLFNEGEHFGNAVWKVALKAGKADEWPPGWGGGELDLVIPWEHRDEVHAARDEAKRYLGMVVRTGD